MRIRVSIALLACCAGAFGESDFEVRGDLERVRSRLEATAREIAKAHDEQDAHTRALARSEVLAAGIQREIARLDDRLASAHARADEARRASDRTRAELTERRHQLARAVRASYRFARRDPIAMLLDLESLLDVDRVLAYHTAIERAHAKKIRGIADAVTRLEAQERVIAAEAADIVALRSERQRRLTELEDQRTARAAAMQALDERIRDGKSRTTRLRADERRLLELIDALRAALSDSTLAIRDNRPFEELRGELPWPVKGPVLAPYGTPRGESGVIWQGVLIGARAGDAVRSIHRGRVAYADWFRGLGLLIIVEHDGGFMSLYGHNRALIRETGDWVDSGEVIATVGDSGGSAKPALYFEIRHSGNPIDPGRWCVRTS